MLHKILVIYLTISLPLVTMAAAPQRVQPHKSARLVEAVEIEGNRRLSAEDILAHIQTRPGVEYSEERIQRDLKSLLDWGVFDTAQTKVTVTEGLRGGVVVIFGVAELLVISGVEFSGLGVVKESELLQALSKNRINLAKGEVYNPVKARAAVGVIKSFLGERGRPNISVSMMSDIGETYISLKFLIEDDE